MFLLLPRRAAADGLPETLVLDGLADHRREEDASDWRMDISYTHLIRRWTYHTYHTKVRFTHTTTTAAVHAALLGTILPPPATTANSSFIVPTNTRVHPSRSRVPSHHIASGYALKVTNASLHVEGCK